MSSTVDSRVVQIQFDNKEFERNVQQTIDSLERLNVALDNVNSGGGLKDLTSGANFGAIASGVDAIKNRFSTFGIVGMTVIQRLTNAGINMAGKIGQSIQSVGDKISQGGFIRAQNLEQAHFLLEGLTQNIKNGGAVVEEVMKNARDAVDGTAYGLDEAAKSAAIFYTSGVKQGAPMFTSLRAIAGAASMTGSSFQGIADVFQDAAAKGAVMTMEIQRLQMQGVKADKYLLDFINDVVDGGEKTKDVSEDVKKSVMELTNGTKLSLEDLTEDRKGLLSKGAISFDIFAAAMDNAFGKHAQEANKTFSGSMANMRTALSRLGEMFITPAMQAAIPLFNSLRLAVSSFADSLKNGNVVKEFSEMVDKLGKGLSALVDRAVELGIFEDLAKIFRSFYRIGVQVVKIFVEDFKKMFPNATIERLTLFVSTLQRGLTTFENSDKVFKVFGYTLRNILSFVKNVGGAFKNLLSTVFSIFAKNSQNLSHIFNTVLNVLQVVLVTGINLLNSALKALSGPITFVITKIAELLSTFSKPIVKKDFSIFAKIIDGFGKAIQFMSKYITLGINKLKEFYKLITTGSKDAISNIKSVEDALAIIGVIFGGGLIFKAIKTIKELFDTKDGVVKLKDAFLDFANSLKEMPDKVKEVFDSLTETLETMQKKVSADIIKSIAFSVLALAVALKIISTIPAEDLVKSLAAISIMLFGMTKVLESLMGLLGSGETAKSVKDLKNLSVVTNQLMKLAAAILIMSVALKIISSIDTQDLAKGLGAMVIMLGAVLGFVVLIGKYGSVATGDKLAGVGSSLMAISVALVILSLAVKNLSSMNIEELGKGLGSIIVLLSALFGFVIGITKLSEEGSKGMITTGIGLIFIAGAINILVPAIQKLGSMDLISLAKGVGTFVVALAAMAAASNFVNLAGSAGIILMSVGLLALANALSVITKIDVNKLAIGISMIALSLGILIGAGAAAEAVAVGLAILSGTMLALSTSVLILGAGLVLIGAGLASVAIGMMTFASVSQTAVLMFANTLTTILTAIINLLPTIAIAIAEAAVSFIEQIAAMAPRLVAALSSLITIAITAIMVNVPKIVTAGLALLLYFLKGIRDNIRQVAGIGLTIIAEFINGLADGMERLVNAGINFILSFINGLANGIREHKEDIRSAILNMCEAILEAFMSFFGIASPSTVMEEQGGNLMQGLINGIRAFAGNVVSNVVSAVSRVPGKIRSFVSKFKEKGGELITNLISGIKGKASDIATKVSEGIKKAKKSISDYVGKFKSAGGDLIKGVAKGISNGLSSVISSVGSIAKQALASFRKKLGIKSPSREFAKLGVRIPEGVSVGIKKGRDAVAKAVDNLGSESVNKMRETLKNIGNVPDIGSDFNPTITPILDLSDVRRGARDINSLLDNQSISAAYTAGNISNGSSQNSIMNELINKINSISDNKQQPTTITNHISVDGARDPEEFVNTFIRTLDRKMTMRAV